jgi:uncharacterized membrane protein
MVPRASARELDMSVDDALKYIISMGVVAPRGPTARRRLDEPTTTGGPVAVGETAPPRN